MKVYLDNAATTVIAPEVFDAMLPFLKENYGNPSSTHSFGRTTRAAIEKTRKDIALRFKCTPGEIVFTSGGTEADNMAIACSIRDLGVSRIISAKIEHHAVSHTVEDLSASGKIELDWIKLDEKGNVDLAHLELLLQQNKPTLVSLMHANNEIGVLLPLEKVAVLCEKYGAYFHSDTVQTAGHYEIDLSAIPVHFITCAAHKFHGPKGIGFLYIKKGVKLKPFINGGSQEREKRGGTENVAGIIGLGKAIEMAYNNLAEHTAYISDLRLYMKSLLEQAIPGVAFNCSENGLYTVLNVNLPEIENPDMLLFSLDMAGVACSGGSACSAGSNKGSHVLAELKKKNAGPNIRFSFCKYTTKEEIAYAVEQLSKVYKPVLA